MTRRGDAPLDSIVTSDGDESLYHVSLPLAAVEAMCEALDFEKLEKEPRNYLLLLYDVGMAMDWLIAGLNCKDDEMILPIVIHTYLMDWRPE